MHRKINFLIVGAQKAGTSALDHYLRLHPEISMAKGKELHFFDNEEVFSSASIDYSLFEDQFETKKGISLYGEATPIYMYWEPAMQRIWDYNRDMRLIAILRNPADRAFSHWSMEVDRAAERDDFFHCIRHEMERTKAAKPLQHRVFSYVDRGFYSAQIQRIFRFFRREQVLFLKYEDYVRNQPGSLAGVFQFLGVNPDRFQFMPQQIRVGNYSRAMLPEERSYLLDLFREDIGEVERLLGWDCGDWKI